MTSQIRVCLSAFYLVAKMQRKLWKGIKGTNPLLNEYELILITENPNKLLHMS